MVTWSAGFDPFFGDFWVANAMDSAEGGFPIRSPLDDFVVTVLVSTTSWVDEAEAEPFPFVLF